MWALSMPRNDFQPQFADEVTKAERASAFCFPLFYVISFGLLSFFQPASGADRGS